MHPLVTPCRCLFMVALGTLLLSPRAEAQTPWLELKSDHFTVFYRAGFEGDAAQVRKWADRAEQLMRNKYGVTPEHYRMSIYLHAAPTTDIDANNARNRCCSPGSGGISTGTIEMLAPSAPAMKNANARSSLGMPKNDESYHAKVLMSEYIPIGHYEVQNRRASGGWKYYDAPNWFVQGLQEYDAIFHTTDMNRDSTARRLSAWVAARPATFTCCTPEFAISDDYNGGAAFMTFLAVEFGEEIHARLLRSSAPTFAEALTQETKPLTRPQLFERLQQWLRDGAPLRRGVPPG